VSVKSIQNFILRPPETSNTISEKFLVNIFAYSSEIRIFFYSTNINANGNIMALCVDCLFILRINIVFLSEEPQLVLPMRIIRQQSNKIFSQQKLHHNVNKHPKIYLIILATVWFISEIRNRKQGVSKKQTLLARANKKKKDWDIQCYQTAGQRKLTRFMYVPTIECNF